jgi:hypothetical protein
MSQNYDIEHIYARERHNKENKLQNPDSLEALGNKILLEKSINIRAAEYRFSDKKRCYNGYTDKRGKVHEKSKIAEFKILTQYEDFTETNLLERNERIHERFIAYLRDENLLR